MQERGSCPSRRYRLIFMMLFLWHCIFFSYNSLVQAGEVSADRLDVMFVIDTSYSMNDTDKDKISMEMVKLFTDISYAKHTRIGFVAYNDSVEAFAPLTEINGDRGREEFKQSLSTIDRTGRTDIGLGLKKGWELIKESGPDRQAIMILLTDGEIDIDSAKSQRTVADSRKDTGDVLTEAAAKGVPIYTIAMGRTGVDLPLLEDIAGKTGAASYIADVPQDLLEVLNHIFAANLKARFVPVAAVVATGETQEVNMKLPYQHVTEGNILFLSSAVLEEMQVFSGSQDVSFHNTQYYSTVKIVRPKQQEYKIRFKSAPNTIVKVNMLLHYDVEGKILVPDQVNSGQAVVLKACLADRASQEVIADKNFYSTFSAMAVIRNLTTQEEVKLPMQAVDKGWELKHSFPNAGRYLVTVEVDNKFYNETLSGSEIQVDEQVPWGKVAIAALVIVLLALIYYRERRPKLPFTGKINAYYLKLKHPEEEVPPFTILLHNFNGCKKVNLFEMLDSVHDDQGLPEGKDIYFSPGEDKTIILSHKSACTIVAGQTVIGRGQKHVLHHGDKVYVTFPGHTVEMELHYKSAKSAETLNH